MQHTPRHRLTWLAIILTFVFLIPAQVIGWGAALAYRYVIGGYLFGGGLFDSLTDGWFSKIAVECFSSALQGCISGALALFLCSKILRKADYNVVAYVNAALVITFTLLGAVRVVRNGFQFDDFAMLTNTIFLVVALFAAAKFESEERDTNQAVVASSPN